MPSVPHSFDDARRELRGVRCQALSGWSGTGMRIDEHKEITMAVILARLTVGETVAEETALSSDCVSDHAEQHTTPDAPGPH